MSIVSGQKLKREYRAHYIDASATGTGTLNFVRIGKDNDDLTRTINYETESFKNVIGETEVTSTRSEDSMDVDPYYIRKDEPLGELLIRIDIEGLELDDLKRSYVEVIMQENGTSEAFMQVADITPTSAGGASSDGVTVPFTLTLGGTKTKGSWDTSTKTFTPGV